MKNDRLLIECTTTRPKFDDVGPETSHGVGRRELTVNI